MLRETDLSALLPPSVPFGYAIALVSWKSDQEGAIECHHTLPDVYSRCGVALLCAGLGLVATTHADCSLARRMVAGLY